MRELRAWWVLREVKEMGIGFWGLQQRLDKFRLLIMASEIRWLQKTWLQREVEEKERDREDKE